MKSEHSHDYGADNVSDRALLGSVIVNVGLSVFEFAAGLISGSVALMADALHNTNDAAALVIAYIARKISRMPPSKWKLRPSSVVRARCVHMHRAVST